MQQMQMMRLKREKRRKGKNFCVFILGHAVNNRLTVIVRWSAILENMIVFNYSLEVDPLVYFFFYFKLRVALSIFILK